MDSNKIIYIDVLVTADKDQNGYDNIVYGNASKTIFEILFEMNAIIGSEDYIDFQDMLNNYPDRYIRLSLNGDNVKIPMVRFSVTDTQNSYHDNWYSLLDFPLEGWYSIDRQSNDLNARYGICHIGPLHQDLFDKCITIYANGSVTGPIVE